MSVYLNIVCFLLPGAAVVFVVVVGVVVAVVVAVAVGDANVVVVEVVVVVVVSASLIARLEAKIIPTTREAKMYFLYFRNHSAHGEKEDGGASLEVKEIVGSDL